MDKTELTKQAGEYMLGAILLNPRILTRLKKLKGANFINCRQSMIFIELRQMRLEGIEIDLVSLKDRLVSIGMHELFIGGKTEMVTYLMDLEASLPIEFNLSKCRAILLENRLK